MAIIKLTTGTSVVLVNPAHIVYAQSIPVTNKAGAKSLGSRIAFSVETKHALRDMHLLDVLESPMVIEQLASRAK